MKISGGSHAQRGNRCKCGLHRGFSTEQQCFGLKRKIAPGMKNGIPSAPKGRPDDLGKRKIWGFAGGDVANERPVSSI